MGEKQSIHSPKHATKIRQDLQIPQGNRLESLRICLPFCLRISLRIRSIHGTRCRQASRVRCCRYCLGLMPVALRNNAT